jgi:hypothetical protein
LFAFAMSDLEQTPYEWFEEAALWYVEKHQGCPWCHETNCLYKSSRGQLEEYHCGACDFFACHNLESDRAFMGPGRAGPVPLTMLMNSLPDRVS